MKTKRAALMTDEELHDIAMCLVAALPGSDDATECLTACAELFRRRKQDRDVCSMLADLIDPNGIHPCELVFRNGKFVFQWRHPSAERRQQ